MAAKGRRPDPPQLRVLKENARRTVAAGPFAGLRDGGAPPKPETVAADPIASAEWDRLVEMLDARRILSPADMGVLTAYVSAYSTVVRCRDVLLKEPLTVTSVKEGATKAHPLLGVLSGAERSLVSFASELGLSPTARGRVTTIADVEKPESKLNRFIE
jgi:P27 family predicted phage terminase small subunit